jgi:hypothetical protein
LSAGSFVIVVDVDRRRRFAGEGVGGAESVRGEPGLGVGLESAAYDPK